MHLHDRYRIDPPTNWTALASRPIKSVSVIGAGLMGRSIALANVEHNIPVRITDASSDALADGIAEILAAVSDHARSDAVRTQCVKPPVQASMSPTELARADLVIEAVVENLTVKKKVLARLEPYLSDEAIVASNTSSIPISEISADLVHAERVCGMHFCHPVRHRPLVEVIRSRQTSNKTLARAVDYVKAIGKLPIVVADRPGFLINRLLLPYMNEALELVLEGAGIESVETAARAFGMPMGPVTQFDAIGIDVAVRAGIRLRAAFPDRVVASELLVALYKTGRWGRKSGAGFFAYKNKTGKGTPDPEVEQMIGERLRGRQHFTSEQITMRLFLPMLVEATRVLEESVVSSVREVDLGLVNGIGFPSSKGGLFFWADSLGARQVVELLKPFEQLGKRFQPTEMLLEMAKQGDKFYVSNPLASGHAKVPTPLRPLRGLSHRF